MNVFEAAQKSGKVEELHSQLLELAKRKTRAPTTAISGATDSGLTATDALTNFGAGHFTPAGHRRKPGAIFPLSRRLACG